MSKIVSKTDPNILIEGNKHTPRSGSFEVEIDGNIIFSKLKTGKFPSKSDIESWFQ